MSTLRVGILGLPNVGKSTLFNALTKSTAAAAANYPFCTIEPNVGVVEVPDERLSKLSEIIHPQKIVPAVVEFVDIAGLVRGASKGEGLGNKFLAHVREADALAEVVRFFEDDDITHVEGRIDPLADKETIETELVLADLGTVEKRLQKAQADARSRQADKVAAAVFYERLYNHLAAGDAARTIELTEDEQPFLNELHLLSAKKIIYVANVDEASLGKITPAQVAEVLKIQPEEVVVLAAKLESEFIGLEGEDLQTMLNEYHVTESGLNALARSAYKLLGLQSFFTAGEIEVRAWTVHAGDTAPQAAGVIHTDFEKAFIRAEVAGVEDFVALGGWSGVREKGKLRVEGKAYVMREGDVCYFLTSA